MATTVYIPLALSTVNIADANAFWTAIDGTNFDYGVYSFIHKSTGTLVFEGIIPQNVAGTPAWDVVLYHALASGTSGTVAISASAMAYSTDENYDVALTTLTVTKSTTTTTQATITLLNGGSLDATLAVTAGEKIVLSLSRVGANAADVNVVSWYLLGPPALKIDVT